MNFALATYLIPAAFLAVPMYKAMGQYGLLNSQWSLILAIGHARLAVRHLGAQTGERQTPVRTRRSCDHGWRNTDADFPTRVSAAHEAVSRRDWHVRIVAGLERIFVRVPAAVERLGRDAGRGSRALPERGRFTVEFANGDRPCLRFASSRHLLCVPQLHGGRPDGRRDKRVILLLTGVADARLL